MPLRHDSVSPSAPASRVRDGIFWDSLAWAMLAAVALFAALTFRDYGPSWDDYTHAEYGDLLLAFYTSGFADRRALSFVNLYLYGGGFDLAATLAAKALPFDLFETRRLMGAVFGLAGLAATWRAARWLGRPRAGAIALLLLATCPLFIGHMMMNPKDAPFATAMAFLLLTLIRLLLEYPKPSWPTRLLFGLALGFALGSRILAGLDAIAMAAALLLLIVMDVRGDGLRAAMQRLGGFLLGLLPAFVLAYAVLGLIWPWAVVEPLNPLRAVGYFSTFFEEPWRELFEGQQILVPEMPARYLPQLLALKLPEILLGLGLAGLIGALVAALRPLPPRLRAALLLTALAAVLPVLVTMVTRPAMYNGIRHFVFVVPPLAVLGGLAADFLARRLADGQRPWRGTALASLLAIGIVSPVVAMARLHPYEYIHFNHIAGGVKGADGRYMLDYWGLSFKQATDSLAAFMTTQKLPPEKIKVAVCGPHRPVQVAMREALGPDRAETTWDPKDASFAVSLGVFYCARLDAPVIADITRDGVSLARVYDLRGANVDTLLTMPGLKGKEDDSKP